MIEDNQTDGTLPVEDYGAFAEAGGAGGRNNDRGHDLLPPDDDEPVGYKRPPKRHRFQPGKSGNPNGRPKGAPGLKKILEQEFGHRIEIREGDRRTKLSKLQVIVKRALEKAMAGDQRAIEHVLSLNVQMFGLGEPDSQADVELTVGEQLYLDAIMKRTGPLSDEEAGFEADPGFNLRAEQGDDDE